MKTLVCSLLTVLSFTAFAQSDEIDQPIQALDQENMIVVKENIENAEVSIYNVPKMGVSAENEIDVANAVDSHEAIQTLAPSDSAFNETDAAFVEINETSSVDSHSYYWYGWSYGYWNYSNWYTGSYWTAWSFNYRSYYYYPRYRYRYGSYYYTYLW